LGEALVNGASGAISTQPNMRKNSAL
jgi:hypothetical protein